MNYLWGYLVDEADVEHQVDFRHQLGWKMAENALDEEEEDSGVEGTRLRARRGTSGDHELVTAPKHGRKWLTEENKWWRVKQTYQKQCCTDPSGDCKNLRT